MPGWLSFLLKAAVSAALIGYLVTSVDLAEAGAWLQRLPLWAALLAVAILYLQGAVFALRWHILLRAVAMRLPPGQVLRIVWIGLFFNQVLPSSVGGDAVRVWYLRQAGNSLADAFLGVMAERVVQVLGLTALIATGLPMLLGLLPGHPLPPVVAGLVIVAALVVALLLGFDRLFRRFAHWSPVGLLGRLGAMLRTLFARPALLAGLVGLSVCGHGLIVLSIFTLARGLGVDLSLDAAFVLVPLAMFVTLIPVSVAGWGVREGALAAGFGLVGVPLEAAVVVSVLFGLAAVLQGLPGGLVWVLARRARPGLSAQSLTTAGSE